MKLLYEELSNHRHFVSDADVKEALADLVDNESFKDYKSLYEYVNGNFEGLCKQFHAQLLEYYREDAQEEAANEEN